jgi:hypothetical protein
VLTAAVSLTRVSERQSLYWYQAGKNCHLLQLLKHPKPRSSNPCHILYAINSNLKKRLPLEDSIKLRQIFTYSQFHCLRPVNCPRSCDIGWRCLVRRGRQRNKAHFAYRRMFQVQPCRVRQLKHRFVFYDTLVCITDMTVMFLDMSIIRWLVAMSSTTFLGFRSSCGSCMQWKILEINHNHA